MGRIGYTETSVTIYQATLRNISAERKFAITNHAHHLVFLHQSDTRSFILAESNMKNYNFVPILCLWTNKGKAECQQQPMLDMKFALN